MSPLSFDELVDAAHSNLIRCDTGEMGEMAMTFRETIISLDGFACRNPKCLSVKENNPSIKEDDPYARRLLSPHHIKYKSHQGPDTKENTITLCQLCHKAVQEGHGKGDKRLTARQYMLKILNDLVGAADYRWHEVHEEYRKRYGEAA